MADDPWASAQPANKELITGELRDLVLQHVNNRREFEKVDAGVVVELSDEQITDATMRAFQDHLLDPRTVERLCERYWKLTGNDWKDTSAWQKELWRKNFVDLLKGVLE